MPDAPAAAAAAESAVRPPRDIAARLDRALARAGRGRVAIGFAIVALAVYLASDPAHSDTYAHYVWQADAWLHGRLDIAWPVSDGPVRNDYYHDVLPVPGAPGLGQIPYPPLPAVVLLPFVAIFGLQTNAELVAAVIGAANAGLAWLLASRLASRPSNALAASVFFSYGTVAWTAAARGTTWYLAHDVAMACTLLAILAALEGRRAWGGFALGLATLARLTAVFGAPFFFLADRGPARHRNAAVAGAMAVPLLLLAAYNLASSGQLFQPSYEELYRTETPAIAALYHPDWAIVDPRYVPQNLAIMLLEPPDLDRQCGVFPTTRTCPDAEKTTTLVPDPLGMSLVLVSPGWLIGLAALRLPRDRLVLGAALSVAAIAIVDLMHFSQGWVQFGYRFSNDWAPFGLVLVALGIERLGLRRGIVLLIGLSVLVNLWGVYWAEVFGW